MTAQPELLRLSAANILFSSVSPLSFSGRRKFPSRSTSLCSAHKAWILAAAPPEVGPIELPASVSSFLAASDDPTLQTSAAILLTGAFTLFLFRSLRRRARLAKQTVRIIVALLLLLLLFFFFCSNDAFSLMCVYIYDIS